MGSRRVALLRGVGAALACHLGGSNEMSARAAAEASGALPRPALGEPLKPLSEYRAALERARRELEAVAGDLALSAGLTLGAGVGEGGGGGVKEEGTTYVGVGTVDDDPELDAVNAVPLDARARAAFSARLHAGELGLFWVTSRGTDRYMMGQRSPFAREQEDLWKLLPERSGPLGRVLQPDFNNPDDKLCLVYSCVNDPRAPPSIDVLYSLKLLDEGLNTEGATAVGLLSNARDTCAKLTAYLSLVDREADPGLVDEAWRNPAPTRGWGKVGV